MDRLIKKLNVKDQTKFLVFHAPKEFQSVLDAWQELGYEVIENKMMDAQFLLVFVKTQEELENFVGKYKQHLPSFGEHLLWVAYPKKTSKKYKGIVNLTRDYGWESVDALNLGGVRMIAIDDDWSAFRLRTGALPSTARVKR